MRTIESRLLVLLSQNNVETKAAMFKRTVSVLQPYKKSFKRHKELTVVNKELEAFAYSVSHDLRAPLRSMKGFSNALFEDCFDSVSEVGKDYLQRIQAGSRRMGRLIDDILSLSQISRQKIQREEVNLSDLAKSISKDLRQSQPARLAKFALADEVVAYGDSSLLRIILENLLGSAWKYTAKQPQAKIEFGAVKKNEKISYFVRDNGAGFDMAFTDKLFRPFQGLHSPGEFEGTGIGLATVERIVSRHNGEVWAEGEIDKGATFYFTL